MRGDLELQVEIQRLNEKERALRKELLDLSNGFGNERTNFAIAIRQLETQVESLSLDVKHAQSEQEYAETTAAKISIEYANLALEYEKAVLQNRNYRKELAQVKGQ